MSVRFLAWAALVCVASLWNGCGTEDVRLLSGPGTGMDAADLPRDSGAACGATPASCRGEASACDADLDCCSGHCVSSLCVGTATCGEALTDCTAREDCCSGRCEPLVESDRRVCLPYCRADGAACDRASDCCGFACHDGVCGGALCSVRGDACATNADCCSGLCDVNEQRCADPTQRACRATGEDCTSGGGLACCGACDEETQRCELGPGPCRGEGELCQAASDCCEGVCADNGQGTRVCGAGCAAIGASCRQSGECCTGQCSGPEGVCTSPEQVCRLVGQACETQKQCCSGACEGQRCVANDLDCN